MTTSEATHANAGKAINQASESPEANLFDLDLALQEGLARADAAWATPQVRDLGALAGSNDAREHARRAAPTTTAYPRPLR